MNTIDPSFFPENIRAGYVQRKIRHVDKTETKMQMDAGLFELIMGSNQIVHNRGRALAYLGGADKKRRLNEDGTAHVIQRHQYDKKRVLGNQPPAAGGGNHN